MSQYIAEATKAPHMLPDETLLINNGFFFKKIVKIEWMVKFLWIMLSVTVMYVLHFHVSKEREDRCVTETTKTQDILPDEILINDGFNCLLLVTNRQTRT